MLHKFLQMNLVEAAITVIIVLRMMNQMVNVDAALVKFGGIRLKVQAGQYTKLTTILTQKLTVATIAHQRWRKWRHSLTTMQDPKLRRLQMTD